ncbi:MAG: ArsR family transcriptional regulator [Euryarchaeota archaeon]|nr:ArsR family transcriptional regulator [Euryarchaeota archaeon]
MQVQKFGIEALDNMLGGGLRSGRPYIISGNSGTGKTILALRFLYEGLKMGEKCLYIATDKPPHSTITSISDSFGWDLLSLNVMDAVPTPSLYSTVYPVRDVTAKGEIREISEMSKNVEKGELTMESIILKLELEYKEKFYHRVVVDSFTTLKRFGVEEERRNPVMAKFFRFFVEKGSTVVLTVEGNIQKIRPELILSSGAIYLKREVQDMEEKRKIAVLKMRGSFFDPIEREFIIDKNGISIRKVKSK